MTLNSEYMRGITAACELHGLNQDYALRQCLAESSGDPYAVSRVGALGLFQFMPATAKDLGINPLDPLESIEGWGRYMAQLLRTFGGDYGKALAAYNWGPGHVAKVVHAYGDNWLDYTPEETREYVAHILGESDDEKREVETKSS